MRTSYVLKRHYYSFFDSYFCVELLGVFACVVDVWVVYTQGEDIRRIKNWLVKK